MKFQTGTQTLVRNDEDFERETNSNGKDEVSKGERNSCEGGRGFIDDVNLHDKTNIRNVNISS